MLLKLKTLEQNPKQTRFLQQFQVPTRALQPWSAVRALACGAWPSLRCTTVRIGVGPFSSPLWGKSTMSALVLGTGGEGSLILGPAQYR